MKQIVKNSIVSLLLGASSLAAAEKFDWTQAVKDAMVLYENEDAFLKKFRATLRFNYQVTAVQPNGSNGDKLRPGASPVNQEFRRLWVGFNADMDHGLSGIFTMRVGGLPIRESYSKGQTNKNYSYMGIFNLSLRKEFEQVKGLYLMGGKILPMFTPDYIESSAANKILERTLICQQYSFDSNWGVELGYKPQKNRFVTLQILANDRASNSKSLSHSDVYGDGKGFKGEFGWEDKCYAILASRYRFAELESSYHQVSMEYAHDFNNVYTGDRKAGANYSGMGSRDAISIGYERGYGKWRILNNVVANWNLLNAGGHHNVGIQVQPMYTINPHFDVVVRYTAMAGDNACSLGTDRFVCRQTNAASWVDSLQTFYIGGNYYYSAKNPDSAKLMVGAEYVTARKNGQNAYSGWTFSTAVRFNF